MIKSIILPAALLLTLNVAVRVSSAPKLASNNPVQSNAEFLARSKVASSQQTKWIVKSLQEMQTIKVGMTRAQLTRVFATEGGLSTRTRRRYVYRHCPYIKVSVEFKPANQSKRYPHSESRNDVITKISQPFLEWSILD
jgi:hypothetical protein